MRFFIAVFLFLSTCCCTFAQQLTDVSFEQKTTDLTAKVNPEFDQNGNACALVKVVAPRLEDLRFEGNYVVKFEKRDLDYYVWMANGAKKLTLRHSNYLPMEKTFDTPLEAKMTYQWIITGAEEGHSTPNIKQKTGWVIIDSQPQGASVYLNDDFVGNTPLDTYKAPYGHFTYRLELGNYHNASGEFDLGQPKYEVTIPLKPAFGSIRVTSSVNGAEVFLDGKDTGNKTPCTLDVVASGSHHLTIQREKYAPQQLDVVVTDGETSSVMVNLEARFAHVNINSISGAEILIDGNLKGITNYSEDLMDGYYEVLVRMTHYRSVSKQIHVKAGQPQAFLLEPTPIYGSLDIMSNPRDAVIAVDGQIRGQTPISIDQILEGEHTVYFLLDGYVSDSRVVNIREGENSSVNVSMQKKEHESNSTKNNMKTEPTFHNGHEYVDLGLPSGTCWATCNVGATDSRAIGQHFGWGESTNKSNYSCDNHSFNSIVNPLPAINDPASKSMGGSWRMPTKDQWIELNTNCSFRWDGAGYVVTGPNGASIYLPAAGYCNDSSTYKKGEQGDYWTSTPDGMTKAFEFMINPKVHRIQSDGRFYGASVRAVFNP